MSSKSKWKEDLKSPWLLGIIGTVVIALSVNITLIVLSYKHPHSLVAGDYYKKGKAYFREQAIQMSQSANGFKAKLILPDSLTVDAGGEIKVETTDKTGKAVRAKSVVLFAYRPNDSTRDFKTELKPDANGRFISSVTFSLPGTWDLIAQVNLPGEKLDVAKRIFVAKQ